MFWVLLAVVAFTFFVAPLLQPKVKGPEANLGEIQPPTAAKGNPVPVIFGTQKVAPNVTWYGNVHAEEIRTVTGNRTLLNPFAANHSQVTGYRYGADIAGVLCHGPIDELIDFQFQDQSMRKYRDENSNYVTGPGGVPILQTPISPAFPQLLPGGNTPVNFVINAPDFFGGDTGEGGVSGKVEFWFGKLMQNASAVLAAKVGEAVSQYKGLVHFMQYDATFGTSPYIKPFYAVVRRTPWTVSPDAATANISGSANPADAIYEVMTDARWGLGKSAGDFDVPSFAAAAVTLKAEGMGVDFTLNAQDGADGIIGEILRHIDGVLYSDPLSGKITLKLARADYVVGTLLHVTPSNCLKLENYKRSTWPETSNEVKINYIARGVSPYFSFKRDTQQAQNLANMQAMGQVSSTTLDFPYFSNGALALKAAFRTLRIVSVPLASATLTVNRTMASLTVGKVFVLDWPPMGISGMVCRVMNMALGPLDSNTVQLTVVEDVFNTAPVVFTAPSPTAWVAPTTAPLQHLKAAAIPVMYYLIKADQFIGICMVVRAGGSSTSWDGMFRDVPTAPDSPPSGTMLTSGAPFTPAGTLVALYPYTTAYQDEVGFLVTDVNQDLARLRSTDAAGLARGDNLAWIASADGGEIIAWRDIIPQATPGQYMIVGVLRGQFDTAPLDHKIGDTVYFFYPGAYQPYYPGQDTSSVPPTATSQGVGAGFKFWPSIKGIKSSLPPAAPTGAIAHPGTPTPALDPQRAIMPLPVGNTRLNTVLNRAINPATLLPDNNTLEWYIRNRLLQVTTLAHDAGTMAQEAGETYDVDVRHVSKATGADIFGVIHSFVNVTSPLAYSNLDFELDLKAANGGVVVTAGDSRRTGGGIRFLIRSKRGAFSSYDIALPGFRRSQQSGYPVVPSLQFLNIAIIPAEPPFIETMQQGVTVTST